MSVAGQGRLQGFTPAGPKRTGHCIGGAGRLWAADMDSKKLGQFLLTGVPGLELDPDTARRFKALQPGGFILFGRNISPNPDVPLNPDEQLKHAEKLRKLIDDLRDLSEIEPII